MASASMSGLMGGSSLGTGSSTLWIALVITSGEMAGSTQAFTKMTRSMAMENTPGLNPKATQATGTKGSSMGLGTLRTKMQSLRLASGRMARN